MKLVSCLDPKLIYNHYTKEMVSVPCKKCKVCHNIYTLQWQKRLEREQQYHRYCVFFTLTYNNDYIPTLRISNNNNLYSIELKRDHYVGKYRVLRQVIEDDKIFIKQNELEDDAYLNSVSEINYLRRKDIQDFMKRLRSNLHYLRVHRNLEDEKIYYFIAGEYGTEHHRPHYHGLLFFDSEFTRANINELLHKSWRNGYINWSDAAKRAGGYVAKYITGSTDLPKVYENKCIKPFFLCSKKHIIGSYPFSKEKSIEIIKRGITSEVVFDSSKGTLVNVPFLRSIESRLFPKITGFGRVDNYGRSQLYRLGKRFFENCKVGSFEEFCHWLNYIMPKRVFDDLNDGSLFAGLNDEKLELDVYSNIQRYLIKLELFTKSVSGKYDRLRNFYSQIRRFEINRFIYKFSVDEYVYYIEQYYSNKKYEQLKNQLNYEINYSIAHKGNVMQLINLDLSFVDRMLKTNYWQGDGSIDVICESFGLNHEYLNTTPNLVDVEVAEKLDFRRTEEYKKLSAMHNKIHYDSLKNKKKNDAISHRKKSIIYGKFIS